MPPRKEPGPGKKGSFENLLAGLSLEECKEFISQYARNHADFKSALKVHFVEKSDSADAEKTYEAFIQKHIKKYSDHSFMDYRSAGAFSREMQSLLKTGEQMAGRKNFTGAFAIAGTLMRKMEEIIYNSDDPGGYLGDLIYEALQLTNAITADQSAAMELKDHIYTFLKTHFVNSSYFADTDLGDQLFDILERLSTELGYQKELISFLEDTIAGLKGELAGRREFLISRQIGLLNATGETDKVNEVVQKNLSLVEVRAGEVERMIQHRDYATARKLLEEGIVLAEKEKYYGTVRQWELDLLKVAELDKDVDTIRRYAGKFAFNGGLSPEYYHKWKKTFTEAEWQVTIAGRIEEVKKRLEEDDNLLPHSGGVSWLAALGPIYVEEKRWDEVLELAARERWFGNVWYFHIVLSKHFPSQLTDIYLRLLDREAGHASDRSDYSKLVKIISKIIKDIPDSREKMIKMTTGWMLKFKTRRAMMDELGKLHRSQNL
jgi:hypothetical protein